MSELSVFNEIVVHQIQGVMLHDDLANMFDFMGLPGFKREQEYHALKEFANMRGTNRYIINHIGYIPNGAGANRYSDVIPSSWRSATKFNVTTGDRKSKTHDLMLKWHEWEKNTKAFYEKKFKELTDIGAIASADKVNEFIKEVDMELKEVERCVLKYSSVDWDMVVIIPMQRTIHDNYEKKEQEELKVKFC